MIAFNRDHFSRAIHQQSPRQPARAGANLDHIGFSQRRAGAGDAAGKIKIQKEILPQRFAR